MSFRLGKIIYKVFINCLKFSLEAYEIDRNSYVNFTNKEISRGIFTYAGRDSVQATFRST